MPKILENVREQLLNEAKAQIARAGYAKTTIRSVAQACGIGTGTVYNYFSSKEMLIASFMLEDWENCLARVKAASAEDPEAYLQTLHEAILSFARDHTALFQDQEAGKTFAAVFPSRHARLRAQVAALVMPVVKNLPEDPEFVAGFIAESLLTWTLAEVPFEKLYSQLRKLIES